MTLKDRNKLVVTGVKQIKKLDSELAILDTTAGLLSVMGKNLVIDDFIEQNKIIISGAIDKLAYNMIKLSFIKKILK